MASLHRPFVTQVYTLSLTARSSNGRRSSITSVTEALAIGSNIIESANNEVVYLSPPSLLVLTSQFSLREKIKMLIQKAGSARGSADSHSVYRGEARDSGYRCRRVSAESLSIDTPVVALWSNDPTYVDLMSTFETECEQSVYK